MCTPPLQSSSLPHGLYVVGDIYHVYFEGDFCGIFFLKEFAEEEFQYWSERAYDQGMFNEGVVAE